VSETSPGGPLPEPSDYPSATITDSRRLMGPNFFSARPGVALEVLGTDPGIGELIAGWTDRVAALAGELGWPAVESASRVGGAGATLYLAAPVDALMTATEVSEQAWAAAEAGRPVDPAVVAALRSAASAERGAQPNLAAVHAEARRRGTPVTFDDEALTLGGGAGALSWPIGEIPPAEAIDWDAVGDLTAALVTGSNGKTTVTRLVAAIWRQAGRVAGLSCSDGVWVDDEPLASGDYSGPTGARTVLRDPRVQVAVLETARGGMLRRGLATTRVSAAIITNISADHFGEYGVDSLGDLADAKSVVTRALGPGATLVLNADDPTLVELAARLSPPLAWFAASGGGAALDAHLAAGGDAAVVRDGRLRLRRGEWHDLGAVDELPLTLRGVARHNVENLAAASLLAAVMGAPVDAIRATVGSFGAGPRDNPGRLQVHTVGGATVLVDYAHNPEGLAALCETAKRFPAVRRLLILGQAGDRDDQQIRALVGAAWNAIHFDRVIVKEMESLLRGRQPGQVPRLIADELLRLGLPAERLEMAPSELEAFRSALTWARPGDLLVCPVHAERAAVAAELEARLAGP
jgi:cyanophycin synthetase